MVPKRLGSLVLAVALGFTVVACGGDDKTATEETTTTAGSNDDTDLAAFTKECAELTQVFAGAYASIGAGLGGAAGNELEDAAEYFENVADNLPKDIRADFQLFAEAYAEFARGMAELDIDLSNPASMDPEQMAKLQELGESLEGPEIEEASANVEAYLEAKCGSG